MIRSVLAALVSAAALLIVSHSGATAQSNTVEASEPSSPAVPMSPVVAEALLRLGDLYADGNVVEIDLPKAYDYYRKSAEAGSKTGKRLMGEMLARGLGVEQDFERGRALVKEIAENDDTYAYVALGDLYSRGDAGPVDAAAAIDAYEKAVAAGHPEALLRLGDLYRDGLIVQANGELAAKYYLQALGQTETMAQEN